MKKILFWIFSAAMTLSGISNASASSLPALKAGGQTSEITEKARIQTVNKSVQMPLVRSVAGAEGVLRAARTGTVYMQRTAPVRAMAEGTQLPELNGLVSFSSTWAENDTHPGLYKVNSATPEVIFEGPSGTSAVLVDDVYYSTSYTSFWGLVFVTITAYDVETGEQLAEYDGNVVNVCMDACVDPTTGTVYAITFDESGSAHQLAKLDYTLEGVTTTTIAVLDGNFCAIACDSNGQLYVISKTMTQSGESFVCTESQLQKIDKNTGELTMVGVTGMLPHYISSATIDTKTNKMYWTVSPADETGLLCEVNLATGAATQVLQYTGDEEIVGLYVPAPAAEEGAPAAVSNLAANFANGSLSGTISFDTPTTTYNGAAATGALTYKILANDDVVAEGNTTFSTSVSAPVTVTEAGEYTFVVTVSNSVGASPKQKVKTFVGPGTPMQPADVVLAYTEGNMNLTWGAVTESVDGGYIDPAAVRYTVTRYPDEVVVVENGTATSFTEAIAVPDNITTYYYEVVAKAGEMTSSVASSNTITLGSIIPPYTNDLRSGSLDGFTVIDANGDGKTWAAESKGFRAAYNSSEPMDDYLVLPPVQLESGKFYELSFNAFANGASFPERLEVVYGTAPTVEALTNVIVGPTDITNTESTAHTISAFLGVPTTGIYYIAIHGISDADMFYLFVRNLSISAPVDSTTPGVCTDIVITPDATGANKANVAFKAPAVDIAGATLTSITKIEVTRDGAVVKTFDNPTPGASLSFDDTLETGGFITYSFTAANASGTGQTVSSDPAFVGFGAPAAVETASFTEEGNTGMVTVTWSAVTTDEYGKPITGVTYAVCTYNGGWVPFVENLTETTYTFQAVPEGEQDFCQFAVFPFYDGVDGSGAITQFAPVGSPYPGINESAAEKSLSYIWGTGFTQDNASWGIFGDTDLGGITSQDGDNGFMACNGQYLDAKSSLMSGKISLEGIDNPCISVWTFNIVGDDGAPDINELNVYARVSGSEEWILINAGNNIVGDMGEAGQWVNLIVPLTAYVNKTIEVRFEAVIKQYVYTMLDNIKVGSLLANDLAATSISAPASVKAGSDYTVDVKVNNIGTADAGTFTVELYADGQKVDSKDVANLAASRSTILSFARNMSAVATGAVSYTATVVYATDENTNNNSTTAVSVAPKFSNLPVVDGLAGTEVAEGVKLTWNEPNLEGEESRVVTETCEEFESWVQEIEDWTFIDADAAAVGGFQGKDLPGIVPGETYASFFVFDTADEEVGADATFAAHSGSKYLASMFRFDDGTVSDWLISPTLSGNAQTVSFYAKSYSNQYQEAIEVYYGDGTTVADFPASNKLLSVNKVPNEWTLYEVEIPEGAMNFAIHSCATGSFMLMIDDITFERGSSTANLSIVGYDVYRNGEKLTATPTGETEFVDAEALAGAQDYSVVVVYNRGLSAPANVTVQFSGIAEVGAGVSIVAADGLITVTGAEGLPMVVNAINGTTLFAGVAEARTSVPVSNGVYLVKVGTTVAKVIVK